MIEQDSDLMASHCISKAMDRPLETRRKPIRDRGGHPSVEAIQPTPTSRQGGRLISIGCVNTLIALWPVNMIGL